MARLYLGVDVGGTKVQASLVQECGTILGRRRCPTPRDGGSDKVLSAIESVMEEVIRERDLGPDDLTAIGIAVPGVVDPDSGKVVVTPNMNLTGVAIGSKLEDRFKIPVALGNDCNLGTLGETWLGSARNAASAVSILVGTGIGSGIVLDHKMWRGARESAAEIGHVVMQIGGPKCGCGNYGCLEALASRSAIERDIRAAIAVGRQTVLTDLLDDDFGVIRSGSLRKALDADDELVTEVIRRASEVLGYACLTVRHLVDPEVIVLGGGVVEACGEFIVRIVEKIVSDDKLTGAREGGGVLLSALADDAVVLGAVAMARNCVQRPPFDEQFAVEPEYPVIEGASFGKLTVGETECDRDVLITVGGKVKKRKKSLAKRLYGSSHTVGPEELARACRGGPQTLFVGTGHSGQVQLTEEALQYLSRRAIQCRALPTPEAVQQYNSSRQRRAALIHVTC